MDFDVLVAQERGRQDAKWGEQNHYPDRWLVILGEEFGEACKAHLECDARGVTKEIIQVAAVCKAMYESMTRNK